MFRGSSGKKFLLITSMTILVMTYSLMLLISNSDLLTATRIMAAPLAQNPYSECPPNSSNIWVRLDTNFIDSQVQVVSVPFDSGEVTISNEVYVNYLLGVLIAEVGPDADFTPVDDETLKAMTIAARTVAYKNCGQPLNNFPYDGIDDNIKQVYDPRKRDPWLSDPSLGQAELDRYQQAIDDTAGMYLTYNGAVFDVQYRDKSDDTTDDFDEDNNGIFAPHKGINDPAGKFHPTPSVIKPGLMQVNSNHWATGENHSEDLTPWNYRQILAHYYTGIHIRDGGGNILTPEYRWNPLEVHWGSTPGPLAPSFTPGGSKSLNMSLQNTGVITWTNPNARIAYQWKTTGGTVVNEGNGIGIYTIAPGGGVGLLAGVMVVQAPSTAGTYNLVVDMQVNNGGSYEYFYNREAGRAWYPLEYICEVESGGQCYLPEGFPGGGGIYLPIIMKNAS